MEASFLISAQDALNHFQVTEKEGLSDLLAQQARAKYGRNGITPPNPLGLAALMFSHVALPEDPPTPVWRLILDQFKDQLVIILLGSAAISFVLALFEDGEGWTAFVDPLVVSIPTI